MKTWQRAWAAFAAWSALWMGVFVAAAVKTYRWGFPLDDAWIHQTYARNLAAFGQWAYRPNLPSAGATAPLWVLLQAVGQALGTAPLVWSALLGWLTLTGVGFSVWLWWRRARPDDAPAWAWAAGLGVSGAWHLIWAALSGMETAFFAWLLLLVVLFASRGKRSNRGALAVGALVGIAAWVRPEGVLVLPWLALAWAAAVWKPPAAGKAPRPREVLGRWVALGAGFALVFAPYVGFNWHLSGHLWPNTFYAKQTEYAALLQFPLGLRLLRVSLPLFVGEGALLLPLAILGAVRAWQRRRWEAVAGGGWVLTHIFVYALRLPVAYQHGRYVLPVLPVALWLGWQGMAALWQAAATRRALWLLSRTAAATTAAAAFLFLGLGARAYAQDVAFIESEMVATARWMRQHLPPDTVVAAHDIGALGYFTNFPLVDLAGLISPQVIPVMNDEAALRAFVDASGAQVLVAFPDWYATLTEGKRVLYANPAGWGTRLGGTHMTVYCWRGSCAIL